MTRRTIVGNERTVVYDHDQCGDDGCHRPAVLKIGSEEMADNGTLKPVCTRHVGPAPASEEYDGVTHGHVYECISEYSRRGRGTKGQILSEAVARFDTTAEEVDEMIQDLLLHGLIYEPQGDKLATI